jgi:hypothetical protein
LVGDCAAGSTQGDLPTEAHRAEHATLRPAGRAGGIDDLGDVACVTAPAPFLDLLRGHLRAARRDVGQAGEAAAVDLPHMGKCRKASPCRGDLLGVFVGFDYGGHRTRVAEDPLDLFER